MVVITPQDAAERFPSVFKGREWLFHLAAWLTGIDKVNAVHDRVDKAGTPYGPAFAKALMEDIEIDFRIGHAERLSALPDGPFIIIANHVYGHIDGICLLDIIGQRRPATKVMVNEMLTWIPGLAPSFIAVNPNVSHQRRQERPAAAAGRRAPVHLPLRRRRGPQAQRALDPQRTRVAGRRHPAHPEGPRPRHPGPFLRP